MEIDLDEVMKEVRPQKLGDLFNRNLDGWQITYAHFLQLEHGLMGIFPALIAENEDLFAVLDKKSLRKVWDHVDRRSAKITSLLVLANPQVNIAFNLDGYVEKDQTRPLRILATKELDELCQKEKPFEWAPGLLQLKDLPVTDPDFDS